MGQTKGIHKISAFPRTVLNFPKEKSEREEAGSSILAARFPPESLVSPDGWQNLSWLPPFFIKSLILNYSRTCI